MKKDPTVLLQIEKLEREKARRRLLSFVQYNFKDYDANWHHRLLAEKLEAVERGEIKRLIVNMPPRHGKSLLTSQYFAAWYLGKHPDREVVVASYSADLAVSFGRDTRNIVRQKEYKNLFNVSLAEDSRSVGNWHTEKGGSYIAVGVGGALTGKGADLLIIDDPIKGRQEAESEVVRDALWDWYRSTAYTRLSPIGAVIICQCMTGDTPVLMADGTEKPLRDIRKGDGVATYDNGQLSVTTIKKWASSGDDNIFTITTSSGKIVRANERHPFLVYEDGKLKWIRVQDLHTAQQIVTLRGSGASGRGKPVSPKDATSQSGLGGTARHTTAKRSGQMDTAPHQRIHSTVATHILNTVTGLLSRITTNFWGSRLATVLCANNHLGRMSVPTGVENFVSTTTTTPTKSGGFSVMIATLRLGIQKLRRLLSLWQSTSDFTLDSIVSIEEDGVEEVFDVQVDRTENFIANGVVSHNTRWADDDLVGRLKTQKDDNSDEWEEINFEAIATKDSEYRKEGEALWPNRYNLERLAVIKAVQGPYNWSALFQQEPIDIEHQDFKPSWFKHRTREEVVGLGTRNFLTIDTAVSEKAAGDYTGWVENFVDQEGNWNIVAKHFRVSPGFLINMLFDSFREHQWEKIGIEKTIYLQAIKPFLDDEMRKRGIYLPIVELEHQQVSKHTRIRGLVPRYERGGIFHIQGECEDLEHELTRFPKAQHDDISDSLAYQIQIAERPFPQDAVVRQNMLYSREDRFLNELL